jgi:DNA-binding response OmpR family regulator
MAMAHKILIVDDEPTIVELVKFNLENAGYQTVHCDNGLDAIETVAAEQIDLVILDIMLPGIDGLEVCKRIRQRSKVPILMLSARTAELDRVLGLELGADDYLTKPFSPRELLARVKAILRRVEEINPGKTGSELKFKDLTLIPEQHRVLVKGKEVDLTLTEYQLLELMLKSPGRVFSRDYLLEAVWGADYFGDTRTIDVHIRHLREKIEPTPGNPEYILTVRGVGYKFKEQE